VHFARAWLCAMYPSHAELVCRWKTPLCDVLGGVLQMNLTTTSDRTTNRQFEYHHYTLRGDACLRCLGLGFMGLGFRI
jgi:hypothetical protein